MGIRDNRLKQRLAAGGRAFGTWIMDARHQSIVRQIAAAGFDFVVLEMEHSSLSWETIGDFCEMARASGITPVVRPAELTRESSMTRTRPICASAWSRRLRTGLASLATRSSSSSKAQPLVLVNPSVVFGQYKSPA